MIGIENRLRTLVLRRKTNGEETENEEVFKENVKRIRDLHTWSYYLCDSKYLT